MSIDHRDKHSVNENLTKNGETITCEWRNTPLVTEDGQLLGAASIVADITASRQQAERLRRSQKMEALGKLTGGIAHDYNNMLNIVLGFAGLLESELATQTELVADVHEITRAAERGAVLTRKLLAFSRQKSTRPQKTDLNASLSEQRNMLEKTLTARISLQFEMERELWPVNIDVGDFEDATINLCINAMHAMKEGGKLSLITRNEALTEGTAVELRLRAGDYVVLTIADTGCGMDEETREQIFDPFFSTKGDKGTGLGLSQVYGFVERSGGAISVESSPGQGARFSLYFPRFRKSDETSVPRKTENVTPLGGKETILVVDDEPAMLKLTRKILEPQGYDVFCASDGVRALEILGLRPIDLLLSDIIMPGMNGFELASIVQSKFPATRIQLASGFDDSAGLEQVDVELRENLIAKPFRSKELLRQIRRLLEQS